MTPRWRRWILILGEHSMEIETDPKHRTNLKLAEPSEEFLKLREEGMKLARKAAYAKPKETAAPEPDPEK